jgi:hypothetical protein
MMATILVCSAPSQGVGGDHSRRLRTTFAGVAFLTQAADRRFPLIVCIRCRKSLVVCGAGVDHNERFESGWRSFAITPLMSFEYLNGRPT